MIVQYATSPSPRPADARVEFVLPHDRDKIPSVLTDEEFPATANAMIHLREISTLFVGLGNVTKIDAHTLRSAAGAAVMSLRKSGRREIEIDISSWSQFAGPIVEGALLANYRFETFKLVKSRPISSLRLVVASAHLAAAKRAGKRAGIVADATNFARDLANQPGNVIFPESLAKAATEMAQKKKLKSTVLRGKNLAHKGWGGVLAVGRGSAHPPRVIILEHAGGDRSEPPIALVGKAVTFDSGGISIKPAANMEEMIFDKCGGVAVLGAMAAIAELRLKQNVIGIVASAENMPSASAYRPGDIVTMFDDKKVEIVNTDAEGRMLLADAIAYARTARRASMIIDLATLTGACGIALGEYAAGLWTSSDILRDNLLIAAGTTGERLWPMPLFPEYRDQIKSEVALLKNSGGRLAGACTAAAFLHAFAEETPWAHLDVAYTVNLTKDRADLARGATGFGVRTLTEFISNVAHDSAARKVIQPRPNAPAKE